MRPSPDRYFAVLLEDMERVGRRDMSGLLGVLMYDHATVVTESDGVVVLRVNDRMPNEGRWLSLGVPIRAVASVSDAGPRALVNRVLDPTY